MTALNLIPLGYLFWPGWWVRAVLMIVIGLSHPPPQNLQEGFQAAIPL